MKWNIRKLSLIILLEIKILAEKWKYIIWYDPSINSNKELNYKFIYEKSIISCENEINTAKTI
jgi:hypothetical protein